MAKDLFIVGSGSQARYVVDIVSQLEATRIIGIADIESSENVGNLVNNIPILCTIEDFARHCHPGDGYVIIAYGKNLRKKEISVMLRQAGYEFMTVVSPLAYVSPSAQIGEGSIVNPFASIMPNARVGCHTIIHSQCVIEHDNVIEDFANIAPGVSLSGNVTIGEGSYIFTGASVIPKIKLGKWCTVGAGAVVTSDVLDGEVVAGIPAKSITQRKA